MKDPLEYQTEKETLEGDASNDKEDVNLNFKVKNKRASISVVDSEVDSENDKDRYLNLIL